MEEVLAKYFSGEATDDEITLVENWRSESKINAKAFFDSKSVWVATEEIGDPPRYILDEIIAEPKAKEVPFMMKSWVKYASAAVLVLAISLLFILNNSHSDVETFSREVMADGSEILLHGNSSLEVIDFNANVREVRVNGKAYFDIERDEERPFIIHTNDAKVKVLGTSFLVKTSIETTEVSVESGLVEFSKVTDVAKPISVKLSKGEMGLVSKKNKGIIKKNNNDVNYLAWKTKVLTFNGSPMREVEVILEDVYGVDVTFENADFKNCKLTAKFNKKKLKDAVEIISRTFGVEYEIDANKVILKGKGC